MLRKTTILVLAATMAVIAVAPASAGYKRSHHDRARTGALVAGLLVLGAAALLSKNHGRKHKQASSSCGPNFERRGGQCVIVRNCGAYCGRPSAPAAP